MKSFAKLMPETKTSGIDCGWGEFILMTYKPRQLTFVVEADADLDDDADEQTKRNWLAEKLSQVVVEWELGGPLPIEDIDGHAVGSVVADGEPVPLDPKVLTFVPIPLLSGIWLGLNADAQPDPKAMQSKSQKRGATQHSGKQNGATDTLTHSPIGSTTS